MTVKEKVKVITERYRIPQAVISEISGIPKQTLSRQLLNDSVEMKHEYEERVEQALETIADDILNIVYGAGEE